MSEVEPYILTGVISAGVALVVRLFDTSNRSHTEAIIALGKRMDALELVGRTLEIWREGALAREQNQREQMLEVKKVLDKVLNAIDELAEKINHKRNLHGGD